MKNLLFPFAFLFATVSAGATATVASPINSTSVVGVAAQDPQVPETKPADAKRLRKARQQKGPDVYKGELANQRRIIIDADGAHKDPEPKDDGSTPANSPTQPAKAAK